MHLPPRAPSATPSWPEPPSFITPSRPRGAVARSCAGDAWSSVGALEECVESLLSDDFADPTSPGLAVDRRALRAATTLVCETLVEGNETFFRRPRSATPDAAPDGHVTPAFEVLLGEQAALEDVLVVALAAAPVRIDRMVTLRLSPASVARGVGEGVDADTLVESLTRVARHGAPENVEAMVREWASRATPMVRLELAPVLRVPRAHAKAIAEALGAMVESGGGSPVLVLRPSSSPADVEARLAALGVRFTDSSRPSAPGAGADPEDFDHTDDVGDIDERRGRAGLDTPSPDDIARVLALLALRAGADRELSARARAAIEARSPLAQPRPTKKYDDLLGPMQAMLDVLVREGAPSSVVASMRRIRELRQVHAGEIDAWVATFPREERAVVAAQLAWVDPVLPFLLAKRASRARTTARLRRLAKLEDIARCIPAKDIDPALMSEVLGPLLAHDGLDWLQYAEAAAGRSFIGLPPPRPSSKRSVAADAGPTAHAGVDPAQPVANPAQPIAHPAGMAARPGSSAADAHRRGRPTMDADDLRSRAQKSRRYGKLLELLVEEGDATVLRLVRVLDIQARGDSFALLVEDAETGETRSYAAERVLDARRQSH